ncbi:hypothetical protein AMTRI_Chr08g160980 [Amborella trichopoda]
MLDRKGTDNTHVFKADLPGLKKEEVKGKKEVEEKDNKWHRVERSQGKFMRQFRLPENGNVEALRMDIKSIEISGYFGVFLVF